MTKLESILKDNGQSIYSFNKEDEFRLAFNPNKKNKNFLPKNPIRDENGYIVLDEVPFAKSNLFTGNYSNNWIVLPDNSEILVKKDMELSTIENELIIMYILKELDMARASYDVAIYKNDIALITPSFLTNNDSIIYPFSDDSSIEDALEKSDAYFSRWHLERKLLLDRLYGNIDGKLSKFGVIDKGETKRGARYGCCPLYDNGELLFERESKDFPRLLNGSNLSSDIISYLLKDEKMTEWIKKLNKINIDKIVSDIYKDKGITISSNTVNNFKSFFKDSEDIINKELDNNGIAYSIHLS